MELKCFQKRLKVKLGFGRKSCTHTLYLNFPIAPRNSYVVRSKYLPISDTVSNFFSLDKRLFHFTEAVVAVEWLGLSTVEALRFRFTDEAVNDGAPWRRVELRPKAPTKVGLSWICIRGM